MRPIYEREGDRKREEFVADCVAAHWKVTLTRNEELASSDYLLSTQAGTTFSLLEIKCRYGYSWTELNFRGTYLLSKHKWDDNTKIAEENKWSFSLAVADKHREIWMASWRAPFPVWDVYEGGRKDRGDKKDIEPCVWIPTDEFTVLVRDRDNPEGETNGSL